MDGAAARRRCPQRGASAIKYPPYRPVSTGWTFDNPDIALYGLASRASTNFCDQKGFHGGRFTGHYIGERMGLLCTPTTGSLVSVNPADLNKSSWAFKDFDSTNWAQVSRAATNICTSKGSVGRFFTGLQQRNVYGLVCLNSDVAQWFDIPLGEVNNAGYTIVNINTVPGATPLAQLPTFA